MKRIINVLLRLSLPFYFLTFSAVAQAKFALLAPDKAKTSEFYLVESSKEQTEKASYYLLKNWPPSCMPSHQSDVQGPDDLQSAFANSLKLNKKRMSEDLEDK